MYARRVVAGGVAAVVITAGLTAFFFDRRGTPPAEDQRLYVYGDLPPAGQAHRLGLEPSLLPQELAVQAWDVPISAAPIKRALLLVATDKMVAVLGEDGRFRRLDMLRLQPAADAHGNQHQPIGSTALSPDGRFAAFPQWDKVVIVNFGEARMSEVWLPGPNEWVAWLGSDLVVAQEERTWLVDPVSSRRTPAGFRGLYVAVDGRTQTQAYELPESDVRGWIPHHYRFGDRIATMSRTTNVFRELEVVVLGLDGAVLNYLPVPDLSRPVQVLGWLDAETVLIRDRDWVLAWHVDSNAVTRVTHVIAPGQVLAISLSGSRD